MSGLDRSGPRPAVVFDLDGVLVDSIAVMREAFQQAYAVTVGPGPAPFEAYLEHLGRHMPRTLEIMGLPTAMYDPFVAFSRELVHRVPRCPGAAELLDRLRSAGFALAVATGKTHDRAVEVLAATGLLDRVDVVAGSDEVAAGKPDPALVHHALSGLGVGAADSVMVGDSSLDLLAGRAAGTRTAAALWGQGPVDQLLACRPDLAARSCQELGDLLLP